MTGRSVSSLYPYHARPYNGSPQRDKRGSPPSAAGLSVTCRAMSRRIALRCGRLLLLLRTPIALVFALPTIVTLLLLGPAAYTRKGELGQVLTARADGRDRYADSLTTRGSWRFLKPVATSHPSGSGVNATQQPVKVFTPNTKSNFTMKYADRYAGNDTDFLVELRDIMARKWKRNVTNSEEFRTDLRAALGDNGRLDKFILTRKNTAAGTKMDFLFNGGSITISSRFWKSLPGENLYRSGLFSRCSVVGSSGILNGSRCGQSIDSADFVFRFNMANIEDFAEDVGSKINFTTLNPSILYTKFNALKSKADRDAFADALRQFNGGHLWLPAFAFRWNYPVLQRASNVARDSKRVTPIYGHPRHYRTVTTLWRDALDGKGRTTTGFHVISSIFDLCDTIDVYGFWPFKASLEGAPVPYHYHDDVIGTAVHSFGKEFKTLVSLHDRGIIQLHVGSCFRRNPNKWLQQP